MAYPMATSAVKTPILLQERLTPPLRVLSVIPAEEEGPAMIFAKRQVRALREVGVVSEPFFLSSRTSPLILLREWRRLRREIGSFRPNLVHAHFGTMTAFFCALAGTRPLVVTYRGSDLNPCPNIPRLRAGLGKVLSQIASLRASRVICVSEQLKGRLLWAKARTTVIPTGVDTELFYPRPRDTARAEIGWPTDERIVLFNAGSNPRIKRLDLAQAAVDSARAVCGAIRFEVLEGATDPKVVPLLLNAADCLLVTSDWEGSPNIVKEAIACNLPVVSVDVGDVRARLAAVEPSRIVERDVDKLGQALADILSRRQRSNGFATIQSLTQERISNQILAVYQAAMAWE